MRETFASNITLTDLQGIGGEDLVNTLVDMAAEYVVEPSVLSEMIARVTRDEAFESHIRTTRPQTATLAPAALEAEGRGARAHELPAEPSRAKEGDIDSTETG